MKHFTKLFKLLTCVMAMVALGTTNAYGSNSKTYYAKAVATATGEGKVYVGISNTAPTDDNYQETSEADKTASSTGNSANVSFYLFAQTGSNTTKFDGWYDNEECTGTALSTANPYTATISSNSTTQASPVTKNYYAKFVEASVFYSSTLTASCIGEGGSVAVSTENDNEDFGAEKSASNLNDVEAAHTYYLQAKITDADNYRFLGWYSDEACETQLSKNANYTYKVTATSSDEAAPTQFHAYAKFELIVELKSTKNRLYFNIGDEPAANDGLTYKNTTITGYTSSNTAVATVAEDGVVTPVAVGSTVITVSAEGVEDVTYVATVLDYSEAGKTQIGNSDFEDWSSVTSNNHAPKNWNSFETAKTNGGLTGAAVTQQIAMSEEHRPGSNGLYSVRIYSRSVFGVVAQGNMTLGCINAGSTTAVSASNHNFSMITDPSKSETIDRIPSAIKVWVKFVPGKKNEEHPNARVAATIHDAHNYITQGAPQFETAQNASYAVAQGAENFPACDWRELTIPFELTGNAVTDGQLYIIVNISTNADPGQGQAGDELYVDDIELVYDNVDYDEASLAMTDAKYSTFCAPMDVNVPYGMKAYTVDGVTPEDETVLSMTEVEDVIPANTPVVLEGTAAANLKAYGVAAPTPAETGLLTGVYEDIQAPVGSYILQNQNDVVGFYHVNALKPWVRANRCYLNASSSSVKALYFNAENAATAINKVEQADGKQMFDMNGRQIQKLQKGINIVNGVKILVK